MDKRRQDNRRALILDRLRRKGMQTVDQLWQYLWVERTISTTHKTLRLDLRALAADGKVKRTPGAMPGHGYGGGRAVSYDGWAAVKEGTQMAKRRPLKSYLKLAHDDDCGIRRNRGATALGAHVMDQVMGAPRCTCGLAEAREKKLREEGT